MNKLLCIFVLFPGMIAGCKTTYVMNVDALCKPGAEDFKTYCLVPGNKGVTPDDLQFLEFRKYLHRAMEARGYVESPKDKAEIVILMSYGIGEPQQRFDTYSYPTYGYQYGSRCGKPVYGVTGYSTQTYSYLVYTHTLKLVAREKDPKTPNDKGRQVWRVTVTSTNTSDDLRSFFPYLVAAAQMYVGEQTEETVKVKIKEKADAAMVIRYGREAWEQMKEKDDDDDEDDDDGDD